MLNSNQQFERNTRSAPRRSFSGGWDDGPILDMEEGRPLRETLSSFIRALRGRG